MRMVNGHSFNSVLDLIHGTGFPVVIGVAYPKPRCLPNFAGMHISRENLMQTSGPSTRTSLWRTPHSEIKAPFQRSGPFRHPFHCRASAGHRSNEPLVHLPRPHTGVLSDVEDPRRETARVFVCGEARMLSVGKRTRHGLTTDLLVVYQ